MSARATKDSDTDLPVYNLIDSHAHLYWKRFDEDRQEVLAHARERGVGHIIIPGTNLQTSQEAQALCAQEPDLSFGAGVHPSDTNEDAADNRAAIEALCQDEHCVAIGETGLDFYHKDNPDREVQEACFRWQIELAMQLNKPVIIHCRDAHEETLQTLSEYTGVQGVLHCFTMGPEEMQAYLDLGLYISFSGVVTFPKNTANRAAVEAMPSDRLLIETDSPFLAPQPKRADAMNRLSWSTYCIPLRRRAQRIPPSSRRKPPQTPSACSNSRRD